jgi:tetratricopeptide (TPR) repeat protein
MRPTIFVSAVTTELQGSRQRVANKLASLGYYPVYMDIFPTDAGDLLVVLRRKIFWCSSVVQLVGQCYGSESSWPDPRFGQVSYTQYEALYARGKGKRVWYLILKESYPRESSVVEPPHLRRRQDAYRAGIVSDPNRPIYFSVATPAELDATVLGMRDELAKLWRRFVIGYAAMIALLVSMAALLVWIVIAVVGLQRSAAVTVDRANAAFIAKDYATAFDRYAQLSDRDPTNLQYHRRVQECARFGRLQKAFFDRYDALVKLQPNNPIFHNYLGNACEMLDHKDRDGKAREQYLRALDLDADFPPPLMNLGIVACTAGEWKAAESYFQRYLKLVPDDAEGWNNLGQLYTAEARTTPPDRGKAAQAEAALREAIRLRPSSARACELLGELFAVTDRKSEALEEYERSVMLDYDQPDVRDKIALLAQQSSALRLADIHADRPLWTRGAPEEDDKTPAVVAAMRLLDRKQFPQAEAVCAEWVKAEPGNSFARCLLARARQGQSQSSSSARPTKEF